MSKRTVKRARALLITIFLIVITNIALSIGIPINQTNDIPRPKTGVVVLNPTDAPRPQIGIPINQTNDIPRP